MKCEDHFYLISKSKLDKNLNGSFRIHKSIQTFIRLECTEGSE